MPVSVDEVDELVGGENAPSAGVTEADVDALLKDEPAPVDAPTVEFQPSSPLDFSPPGESGQLRPAPLHLGKPGQVTAVDPDTYRLTPDAADRAARLGTLFHQSWATDADRNGAMQRFAKASNLKFDVVRENFPELKQSWEAAHFDPVKWMQQNEHLATLVLDHPELGATVERDQQLSYLHRAMNWVLDHDQMGFLINHRDITTPDELRTAFAADIAERNRPHKVVFQQDDKSQALQGGFSVFGGGLVVPSRLIVPFKRFGEMWAQMGISKMQYELMLRRDAGQDTFDLENRLQDARLEAVQRDYNEGPIEQVFTDVAQAASSSAFPVVESGPAVGTVAAAAGLGTLYATRSPRAAGAAALEAGSMVGKAGAVYGTFQLESGSAYGDMLDHGLDEPTARVAAKVYGTLAAGIEFASWGPMFKALGPVGSLIKEDSTEAFTKALLHSQGFRTTLKHIAGEGLGEGGEEFLQDATQQAVEYFARAHQVGFDKASTQYPGVDLGQSLEAGVKGTTGGLGLGVAHAGIGMTTRAMFQDRARESRSTVELLAGFSGSETAVADPEAVAEMIGHSNPGLKALFVAPEAFVKLYQDAKVDPSAAAQEVLGENGPRLLQEALATGQKLEVPLSAYIDWGNKPGRKLTDLKQKQGLVEHTTTDAAFPTPALIDEKEIKAQAEALAESFAKGENAEPETPGEAAFLDVAEKQLATVTGDGVEARQKMQLLRAFARVQSERFGQDPNQVFKDMAVLVEAGRVPTAHEILSARAQDLSLDRSEELYRDQNTGLPNELAFKESKPAANRPRVAHLSVEGIKWLNDNVSHDRADLLYRAVAQALHSVGQDAFKVGGDFAFYTKGDEGAAGVLNKVREALPPELRGFELSMATGGSLEEAAYKNQAQTAKAVNEGKRANPRPLLADANGPVLDASGEEQVLPPEKPKGLGALEPKDIAFPEAKAAPALDAALREAATKLTPQDYFNKAYVDQQTGEWTAKGWAALPRKAHVVSIDLAGLRKVNENFGPRYGDLMLEQVGLVSQAISGETFDFAHLHGDEYAAQSDDPKELETFVERLRAELLARPIGFVEPETGELTSLSIEFHHGYGERSLEAADADLNGRKRRFKEARKAGLDVGRRERARPGGHHGTAEGGDQGRAQQADRAAAARADGYAEARALIARARSNKPAYESWFRWAVEKKGQGERPKVSWAVESTMARYGVVDPINGFSGNEAGRDMAGRTIKGDKSKGGDLAARQARAAGIGLTGNAADANETKHTQPAQRRFFQPPGPETLMYPLKSDERGYMHAFNEGMQRLYKVVLNPAADHSTFLHESAHVFLHMLTELAQRPDAPEKVKADYAAALKWLDAKGPQDLEVKSAAENDPARQRHEKWAKAFERYLLEGQSPARKLVRMFERFRLWLSQVYRDPRVLGAPLSDDIRRVFDRMLATDREIENYQKAMGLEGPPLARDVLGMTPEQYQDYLDERLEMTSTVTRRLDHSAAADQLREQEAWWKDEALKEREKAAEAYEALPARIAQQTLAGRGELGGHGGTGRILLGRELVVQMVGDKAAKKFATTNDESEATHPDEVADFLGYPTGKAMLEGVLALPGKDAWVKQAADAAMQQKHPDVVKDLARLREQVGKGWHGDATEKYFLREWAALRLKVSQAGQSIWAAQTAPIEVVQLAARETVANRTVGRLEVGQALAAEKRSGDACLRAAAQGNFAKAFAMKQQQLLNFYVWRELSQAREERDAFVELAAELSKKPARERLGKASPVYRNAVDTMLEALGLREPVPDNPGAGIDDVVAQMAKDGQVIGIDEQALQQLEVKPKGWKDLTVGEMRAVRDALSSIKAAARGATTVLLDGKRIDKDEAIARIVDEGGRHLPPLPPGTDAGAETWREWAGGWWNAADGAMLKNETMVHWLGGNDIHSTVFRLLALPLQAAKHAEVDLLRGPIKSIVKAFDAMPRSVRARATELVDGKTLFPGHVDRIKVPTRRWQVLMLLLNSGNASNLDRLTEGRNITEQQVRDAAVTVGITKEEYDWVQSVWDACEALKKPAFDLEERDTGIRPEEIKAREFQTPFGVYRGGYFPAVYDRRGESGVGAKQELQSFMDPTFTPIGTARGHLKSRVEGFSDIVSLSPSAIYRHLAQVAHDIAYREAVRSVGQLVTDDRVMSMLRQRLGEGRADTFVQYVKDVGRMRGIEGDAQVRPFLGLMQGLRGAMAMSVLGGSTPNVLEDAVTGLTTAVLGSELKAKHLAAGVAAVRGYSVKTMSEAEAQSGELRSRHGQLSRELLSQLDQLISKSPLARGPLRFIKDHAFAQQEIVDRSVAAAIWIAAKRQATEEGESSDDAVVFADKIVRQLLPSQHVVDTAALLRNKGFIGASLIFFRFWSTAYNTLRRNGPDVLPDASLQGAKNTGMAMGYVLAFSILGSLARGQGPDPGEPWDQWFMRKALTGFAGLFPWAGDLAEMGFADWSGAKKREPRNNSIAGMLVSIYQLAKQAGDGDKDADQRLRAAIRALGLSSGLPFGQPLRTGGYLYDLAAGNVEARGPGDVIGGLIYGQTQQQSANVPTLIQDAISGPR